MLEEAFDLFVAKAPATVMIRGVLENILSDARLNALFGETAQSQRTRELAFASVVRLMSQVVTRIQPSVHAAYRQQAEELGVSAKCIYDKLEGIEPVVTRGLVRRTAREMELVIEALGSKLPSVTPGFRLKILDGNHLAGTDRRLKPLRGQAGAALPGQALAVLDPALKLVIDLFPCEDAHRQERALLGPVLETVEPGDLWIEDRNFCTTRFLFGVSARGACFLVRQHSQTLRWEALDEPVFAGEIDTGRVFHQHIRALGERGEELILRRIRLELYQPTRDGDTVLHLLTNLPEDKVDALAGSRTYCGRWQIETAFQELTVDLACEVQTLGYPKAALFAFGVAVLCYNAFSVTKAALRTNPQAKPADHTNNSTTQDHAKSKTPKPPRVDELSTYYMADEIAGMWRGIAVVLPDEFWRQRFAPLTSAELAECLRELAQQADLSKYKKRPPSAKRAARPPPCQPGSHVSTARVLEENKTKRKC